MGHVAAAVSIGATLMGGISAYRQGKAEKEMALQKADAEIKLGDHNALQEVNNSISKVNSLNAQSQIAESNAFKKLDKNALEFTRKSNELLQQVADLRLKVGSNYSSYDYMKAVDKQVFESLTDYDYDTAMATQQAYVQQNEFDRKAKFQYSLGLANADMIKYNANLKARGLRFQGELAESRGQNKLIGSVASAAGQYASASTSSNFKGQGIFV
jgi:hypothetical protein